MHFQKLSNVLSPDFRSSSGKKEARHELIDFTGAENEKRYNEFSYGRCYLSYWMKSKIPLNQPAGDNGGCGNEPSTVVVVVLAFVFSFSVELE